jgi:HTH-type transcriptional regulator/antitoxin HigA
MKAKIIKTPSEHAAALAHVEKLMGSARTPTAEAELELWALLVESYEEEHFPIAAPDPVEAILFRMDQKGLKPADLQKYLRHKGKVSEILNRKRSLSLAMIRSLHAGLKIPAEVLVQEPRAPYGTVRPRRTVRKRPASVP